MTTTWPGDFVLLETRQFDGFAASHNINTLSRNLLRSTTQKRLDVAPQNLWTAFAMASIRVYLLDFLHTCTQLGQKSTNNDNTLHLLQGATADRQMASTCAYFYYSSYFQSTPVTTALICKW